MTKLSIAVLLIVSIAALGFAQEPAAPKPGPEHKKIEAFAGKWNFTGKAEPGPMGGGGAVTFTDRGMSDDKLICKYIKETGSRLMQQKVCATKRQWELTELETQETIRDRQNRSTLTGGSEPMSISPGQGPR